MEISELACVDSCGRRRAREWLEMGGKEKPLGMSELGCADSCGRRGCKGVAGNGWGEEVAGDERAWLRGWLRTAWVQGNGWKWVGSRSRLAARTAADGVGAREWLEMGEEAAGDERAWLWVEMGGEKK